VNNDGTLNILSGATFTNTGGTINNTSLTSLNIYGGSLTGTFNNTGAMSLFNTASGGTALITNGNGAQLTFNDASTAGTATLINNNGGTLTFNDTSTGGSATITNNGIIDFSGVTTGLTIGTLTGSTTGSIGGAGKTLTIGDGTYDGTLGPMSALIKTGPGTLSLNGNNSAFSSPIDISGGTLTLGSASGSATLGNGTGLLTVGTGATLSGYGTFNFNNATFQNGSTYRADLTPPASSGVINATQLTISTTNTILEVNASAPLTAGHTYTIATYGTLTGTFASVVPIGITEIENVAYGSGTNSAITVTARTTTGVSDVSHMSLNTVVSQMATLSKTPENFVRDFSFRMPLSSVTPSKYKATPGSSSGGSSYESVIRAISQQGPQVISGKKTRLWLMPYYMQGKTKTSEERATQDSNEGLILGGEYREKNYRYNLGFMLSAGWGKKDSPSVLPQDNSIKSSSWSIGAYTSKAFLSQGEIGAIINISSMKHESERLGNPLPGITYVAHAHYRSYSYYGDLKGSWLMDLEKGWTFRPNIGFTLTDTYRTAFKEKGAGLYNQQYQKKKESFREPYAGLGLRRKWRTHNKDLKITGIYEAGYNVADDGTLTRFSTESNLREIYTLKNPGTGRLTHYLTLTASCLNTKQNLKLILGYGATLQKSRTAHALSLKVEKRF